MKKLLVLAMLALTSATYAKTLTCNIHTAYGTNTGFQNKESGTFKIHLLGNTIKVPTAGGVYIGVKKNGRYTLPHGKTHITLTNNNKTAKVLANTVIYTARCT